MDPQLKQLMKELGDAINESLSDSEQISEVVSRIKEGGYDIFLVLEATIGFNKREDATESEDGETIERLLSAADTTLYEMKRRPHSLAEHQDARWKPE